MSIVDAIKKLREQLTGEPGKGASITDAINDLTEGLTGEPGVGASIADALSNLAEHADDISGGGGGGTGEAMILPEQTVTIAGPPAMVEGLNFEGLSDGANVKIVVNTEVGFGTYNEEYTMIEGMGKDLSYLLGLNGGVPVFMAFSGDNPAPGTYTVACYKSAES